MKDQSRAAAALVAVLGTVGGATDEGNSVTGLIVDTAAGDGSWTLGTTSCIG